LELIEMGKQVLFVGEDFFVEKREMPEQGGLEFLQSAVKGYVQSVDLRGEFEGVTLWVNEEGKFLGNSFNLGATYIWESVFGKNTDYIVGNAIFTGGADDEGDTLPLTQEQTHKLMVALESALLAWINDEL
jgi:hypothetical protein